MRLCQNCGRTVAPDCTICPICGAPLLQQQTPPASASYSYKQTSVPKYRARPNPTQHKVEKDSAHDTLSTASYFWHLVVFAIPVIGWLALLYCAFGAYISAPVQKLARAVLLKGILFFIIGALLLAVFLHNLFLQLNAVEDMLNSFFEDMPPSEYYDFYYNEFEQYMQNTGFTQNPVILIELL